MIQGLIGAWLALLAAGGQTAGNAETKGYNHPLLWFFAGLSIFGFFTMLFLPNIKDNDLSEEELETKQKRADVLRIVFGIVGIIFLIMFIGGTYLLLTSN